MTANVALRDVYDKSTMGDNVGLLYGLLMARPKSMNISHHKMPTYGEHCLFVEKGPYRHWFIILDGTKRPVGHIYLTHQREVGIQIADGERGKGYGHAALGLILVWAGPGDLFANINPTNRGSQKFFGKAGFRLVQHTYRLTMADGAEL